MAGHNFGAERAFLTHSTNFLSCHRFEWCCDLVRQVAMPLSDLAHPSLCHEPVGVVAEKEDGARDPGRRLALLAAPALCQVPLPVFGLAGAGPSFAQV